MTVTRNSLRWAALLCVAMWPAAAWAQFGFDPTALATRQGLTARTISVVGGCTVPRKATQLRLYMEVLAKGKTLEDALAKLKEREEAATAQLETLKADKKSIVFTAPGTSNQQSARRRQIEAMVMTQMRARGKRAPKGLDMPKTVTLTVTLTAQWPLEMDSHEKTMLMVRQLEEKIKAADLAGVKESQKLSPDEEEFEEEAAQMAGHFGGEEQAAPGQPQFVFVATLPKQERQKALAEAVAKANQQAAELAQAAGVELGPLVGLSGACSGQINADDEGMTINYGPYGGQGLLRRVLMARQTGQDFEGRQDEAMGTDPSTLKFTCNVAALFQIGK